MDENGNIAPERKEHFKAFVYFINRILPSVNTKVTDYNAVKRKNNRLSNTFTVTDEAFALACVENYRQRWEQQALAKESRRRAKRFGDQESPDGEVPPHLQKQVYAKWSGSHLGNTLSGWTKEGIQRFNDLATIIKKKRVDSFTGEELEECIKKHWKGTLKETKKKKHTRIQTVVPYQEDDEFDGKYAAV